MPYFKGRVVILTIYSHWIGGWMGLEQVWTTCRTRENSWLHRDLNSDPSVVQPVASRYTNYAILVPLIKQYNDKYSFTHVSNHMDSSSSSSYSYSLSIKPGGLLWFHSIFLTVFLAFFSMWSVLQPFVLDSVRIYFFNVTLPTGTVILNKFRDCFDFQVGFLTSWIHTYFVKGSLLRKYERCDQQVKILW
jgi:hypothetical protein